MKQYTSLADRIGAKKYHMVMSVLNNNKEIDVTYNEGEFFIISIKQNSTGIVKALLDYFKQNQLSSHSINKVEDMPKEDQLLMLKIRNILDVATQDVDLSQEMKEVLSPYIDFEGSENHDSFLEDENLDNNFIPTDQIKTFILKKSYSENDLHSTFDNSKEILLTEENLKRLSNNSSGEKPQLIEEFLAYHVVYDTKEYHSDIAGNLDNTDEL